MRKLMFFCGVLFIPFFSFAHSLQHYLHYHKAVTLQSEESCFQSKSAISMGNEFEEDGLGNDVSCLLIMESVQLMQDDTLQREKCERLDSIVVDASRAGVSTPVTFSQVSRRELQRGSSSHSLPMMLQLQPSVVATTEGGLGLGYSKLWVRGTDDSRINVTLNGIAMNDAESQQVFWVNLPAMHSFLNSAQLQRGVGTSANGSGAFGASLNLQSKLSGRKAYGAAEASVGSYGTFLSSIAVGSGELPSGFSFDMVYSRGLTDGYIRNAKADLHSLFAVAGWERGDDQLKLSYILGDQCTGITWEGVSLEKFEVDPRYNVAGEFYDDAGNVHYYDNETDNYRQHYVQAAWNHSFSPFFTWSNTLNFTKGDGFYENYKADTKFSKYGLEPAQGAPGRSDFIVQQAMDNSFYAANSSLLFEKGFWKGSAALSYGFYDGDHFGDVLWCKNLLLDGDYRWYENSGRKSDWSGFVRAEYSGIEDFTFFADLQYRGVRYALKGIDKDFALLDWEKCYNFFNPKAGVSYAPDDNGRIYASVAVAHREPSRSDIKESIKSGSASGLKAERLVDVELGYRFSSQNLSFAANLFFMEYKDQLVATGKLSDVGYVIKENMPVSFRRGIELSGGWQCLPFLRVDANLTLSRNKAVDYTAFVDTYNNPVDWESVAQTPVFFESTNLVLSPEVTGMGMVSVSPGCGWDFSLSTKYVGKQFMDNFNSSASVVPAYFVSSLKVLKGFRLFNNRYDSLELSFVVDNLFNHKYFSYGWIYQAWFADGSSPYVEQGVYPQAPINFCAKMALKF